MINCWALLWVVTWSQERPQSAIYGLIMSGIRTNNIRIVVMKYCCAHSSAILVFITLFVSQLRKKHQERMPCSLLQFIQCSLYVHSLTSFSIVDRLFTMFSVISTAVMMSLLKNTLTCDVKFKSCCDTLGAESRVTVTWEGRSEWIWWRHDMEMISELLALSEGS